MYLVASISAENGFSSKAAPLRAIIARSAGLAAPKMNSPRSEGRRESVKQLERRQALLGSGHKRGFAYDLTKSA